MIQLVTSFPFGLLVCVLLYLEHIKFGSILDAPITKEAYVERLITGVATVIGNFSFWLLAVEGQRLPVAWWQPLLVIWLLFGLGAATTWSVYKYDEWKAQRDQALVNLGVALGNDQTPGDDRTHG